MADCPPVSIEGDLTRRCIAGLGAGSILVADVIEEAVVFRVMTWNVENLFKPGAPSGPSTQQAYQAKIAGLAALISSQDPDVLAVQELGDPDALSDLIDALGGTWHRRVSQHPDQRGIRVAWLAT